MQSLNTQPAVNKSRASVAYRFIVVATDPLVTITSPEDGDVVSQSDLMVEGTAADDQGITSLSYQLNSGADVDIFDTVQAIHPFSFPVDLSEGANSITVTAGDANANSGSQTITVTLDSGGSGNCQDFTLTIPGGTIQAIPGGNGETGLHVARSAGFSDDIAFTLEGSSGTAPSDILVPGLMFDPNPSEDPGGGNQEVVALTTEIRADAVPGTYTLSVVGISTTDETAGCSILHDWEILATP